MEQKWRSRVVQIHITCAGKLADDQLRQVFGPVGNGNFRRLSNVAMRCSFDNALRSTAILSQSAKSIPSVQFIARGDLPGGYDVRAVPAELAKCGRSAVRAQDRHLSSVDVPPSTSGKVEVAIDWCCHLSGRYCQANLELLRLRSASSKIAIRRAVYFWNTMGNYRDHI